MSTIGIVIVTFRGGDSLIRTLECLTRARERLAEGHDAMVVIVDNASYDGTADRARENAPWARVTELPENVGFAAACNIGIGGVAESDVVVLLNPDVAIGADFLARVAQLDWPSDLAARGPAIFDAGGGLEQSARGFPRARTALLGRTSLLARIVPTSRVLRHDLRADTSSGPRIVDWVSGACMIVPTDRFRAIGPLDDGYFMYWEDADWCHRARTLGYSVLYDPSLVVTHYQGSSSRYRPAATILSFHRSAARYWRRNVARSPVSVAVAAGALTVRCILKLAAFESRTLGLKLRGRDQRL